MRKLFLLLASLSLFSGVYADEGNDSDYQGEVSAVESSAVESTEVSEERSGGEDDSDCGCGKGAR